MEQQQQRRANSFPTRPECQMTSACCSQSTMFLFPRRVCLCSCPVDRAVSSDESMACCFVGLICRKQRQVLRDPFILGFSFFFTSNTQSQQWAHTNHRDHTRLIALELSWSNRSRTWGQKNETRKRERAIANFNGNSRRDRNERERGFLYLAAIFLPLWTQGMCFMKHGWWEVESEREQGSPGRSPHSSLTDEKWISFRFLAAVGTRKPTRTHADCPRAGRWKEAAQEGNLLRDWYTRTEKKRDLCQVHDTRRATMTQLLRLLPTWLVPSSLFAIFNCTNDDKLAIPSWLHLQPHNSNQTAELECRPQDLLT